MPGCSTASLGALSLAGRGLGQAFIGYDPQCAELSSDVASNPALYDDAKAIALRLG